MARYRRPPWPSDPRPFKMYVCRGFERHWSQFPEGFHPPGCPVCDAEVVETDAEPTI